MKRQDYYSILGIERSASDAEIKQVYRRLARRFHPDVTDDPDGESKFKRVAEAYRTLKCPATRIAYNRQLLPLCGGQSDWIGNPLRDWYALFPWLNWTWYWPE